MDKKNCINCTKLFKTRSQIKYCSNKCQKDYQHKLLIEIWKKGKNDLHTKNISKYLKRYFFEKYNNKCSMCGWNKCHPLTGNIPLEIDHIDGNSKNNAEKNLRLLCPNCHSLTINFKNLNRGNGRKQRK